MKPLIPSRLRSLIGIGVLTVLAQGFSAETASTRSGSTNALEAGHSLHGEAFNEGPRQSAKLLPGTGKVKIKISTKHAEAQAFFNQGVGQSYGFWFFEAERSFRQVAALDTNCAMAYWGMAMANVNNEKRAKEFITAATARKFRASKREQQWIDGLAGFYADTKRPKKERE